MQTPYFILHQNRLRQNLKKLQKLENRVGVSILHTLKSFNQATVLPLIGMNLSGMSITSPKELKMAQKANAKAIHLYAPAFKTETLQEMLPHLSTLSLNSLTQWQTFSSLDVSKGLRINPQLSLTIPTHCNPNLKASRLGVDYPKFLEQYHHKQNQFKQLEGLHFHALFQDTTEGLKLLLEHILNNYQEVLPKLKWLNLGGGHNFTDPNYEVDTFVQLLHHFKTQYPNIKLYFEPGQSVTQGCGEFVTTVLDIITIENLKIAILDTSIETHLLDVAIVKQRLKVQNTQTQPTPHLYELTGNSCLHGDIIGKYFFTKALQIGDQVIFENMMPYTMVKMTEFNGMERAGFYLN